MIRNTENVRKLPQLTEEWSEHYRALADRLKQLAQSQSLPLHALGVTSATRREGVSTVAANLAHTVARLYDQQVLLVDANFAHGSVHKLFGATVNPGLADVIVGTLEPPDVLRDSSEPGLSFVTAGSAVARRRTVYDVDKLYELFDVFKQKFDLVVVDLPAATPTSPCFSLASTLDGVVMVVEAERIQGQTVQKMKQRLVEAQANPLGAVFNKRPNHVPSWLSRRN